MCVCKALERGRSCQERRALKSKTRETTKIEKIFTQKKAKKFVYHHKQKKELEKR